MEEEIEVIRSMGFTHVPRETIVQVALSIRRRGLLTDLTKQRFILASAPLTPSGAQVLCEAGGSMDAAIDRILALPESSELPPCSVLDQHQGHGRVESDAPIFEDHSRGSSWLGGGVQGGACSSTSLFDQATPTALSDLDVTHAHASMGNQEFRDDDSELAAMLRSDK